LTHEPNFLRQSCETPRNSVCWRKRLASIQLGRLTFRRTVYLSAISTMLIGRPNTVTWFALRNLRPATNSAGLT
jgi:hypothetical protein